MRSVRLDEILEERLEAAARLTGEPVSRIIRSAIEAHCDRLLGDRLDHRLSDVVGSVSSGGGNSRRTGKAFAELLASQRERRK